MFVGERVRIGAIVTVKLSPGDFTASATMTKPKPEVVNADDLPDFYMQAVVKPDKKPVVQTAKPIAGN